MLDRLKIIEPIRMLHEQTVAITSSGKLWVWFSKRDKDLMQLLERNTVVVHSSVTEPNLL